MDFLELAKKRFSVRNFTDEPLSQEIIDKLLLAAKHAPTACNLQPQRILVVNNEEAIEKLQRSTKCHFGTKTAFIVFNNTNECWQRKYDGAKSGIIDASIVATHLMLEAEQLGVGCTWVMHFNPAALKTEFAVPEDLEPVAILVMGYPSKDAKPIDMHFKSKEIEEFVLYNQF